MNDVVQTFPLGNQLKCNEKIRTGVFYQYVLTRNEDGEVALYLNGYPCGRSKVPCKFPRLIFVSAIIRVITSQDKY